MNINELTIGQVKKIAAMLPLASPCGDGLDSFAIGQSVIIRTYSAGVWFGILDKKVGNEVILKNARRMWLWKCKKSISLSGVVKHGIDQKESKIAPAIEYVWLEAIEIMPIKGEAAQSISEAEDAEAR